MTKELIPLIQTALWIIFAFALLLYFWPLFRVIRETLINRLKSGGGVTIGPLEIKELKERVDNIESKMVKNVSELFLFTMTREMYKNLRKLYDNNFPVFIKSKGLERELYYLRDIGYIKVESISAIPLEGKDLTQYVSITESGRKFIELRESLHKETSSSR